MPTRIYVDFNTMAMDPQERVSINSNLQPDLVAYLQPGQVVTLYDEEMEVEGVVEFNVEHHQWLAQPYWETRQARSVSGNTTSKVA